MKKKSFLSGIGAKLALAAVALTTGVFTSCEKEEFNVEPVELSPASATIVATVYDLTTGEVLAPQAIVETITAGTDGTIAATTKEISCPSFSNAEYLPVEAITVAIPKLAKGQFALIPVNFYAQKIVSAAKNVTVSEDPTTIETTEVKNTPVTYGPYDVDKNIDIEYAAKVGSEVVNIKAFLDTGNRLVEPATALPVIIAEREKFRGINIKEKDQFRIPYKVVDGNSGYMKGIKIDNIKLCNVNGETMTRDAILCFCDNKSSKEGEYEALLSRGII